MLKMISAAWLLLALAACPVPAIASPLPEGTKTITLVAQDGTRLRLGEVTFVRGGGGASFTIKLDAPELQEQFLSMRPFQCLSGAKLQWCYMPYDYGLRRHITAGDLVDLEYSLMFFWRTYDRVSANAWNGLYFKLALEPDGSLAGTLHETDLNVLAVPPADEFARPILDKDLTPAQPGYQQFERIEIK